MKKLNCAAAIASLVVAVGTVAPAAELTSRSLELSSEVAKANDNQLMMDLNGFELTAARNVQQQQQQQQQQQNLASAAVQFGPSDSGFEV